MALNIGLEISFGNTRYWKGVWEEGGGVNSRKAYTTNDETSQ
jgi:hypothetical protein